MLVLIVYKAKNNGETTNLDERGAAEEEAKHVGHNVIADHTGNWHNEPTKKEFTLESYETK